MFGCRAIVQQVIDAYNF